MPSPGNPIHGRFYILPILSSIMLAALEYKFLGLPAAAARKVFLVLIVSLHAVFLGVARL